MYSRFEQWWIDEADSTNCLAVDIMNNHSIDVPKAIICRRQTKGKGQGQNSWESEAFRNVTMSLIIKTDFLRANEQFLISQATSLAIVDFLSELTINAQIKWPNDIYVGKKKICGILIEHRIMGEFLNASIIGIGLNVNQSVFLSDAPNPTSIVLEMGEELAIEVAVDKLLYYITKWLNTLQQDYSVVQFEYVNSLYLYNKVSLFNDFHRQFWGEIRGVMPNGILQIWDIELQQLRSFVFKEVAFVLN